MVEAAKPVIPSCSNRKIPNDKERNLIERIKLSISVDCYHKLA